MTMKITQEMQAKFKIVNPFMLTCLVLTAFSGLVRVSAQDLSTALRKTENEQFIDAKAIYEALIIREPNNGDNYYYFGINYLKSYFTDSTNIVYREVSDKATELFQKGIQVDSANPLNFIGMGKLALQSGNIAQARSYFDKAESLLPTKNKKVPIAPEKHVGVYQKIADAYLRSPAGDTADVFPYLRKAEKLDKKSPETYLIRGDAYLFLINDGSNAIVNYKRAQDLDPTSAKAKLRLGQLWVRAKRPMDALGYYQEAISIDSTFAPAYREMAELYRIASQYDNAQKMYKKFLDLNQQNLAARVRYASFLFLSKNYNETIIQSREILQVDPLDYNFLNRLAGYSCYETNQFEEGITFMETFFKQTKPDKILASDYSYYGRILSKLGKDSLAVIQFEKAINIEPDNVEYLSDEISSFNKMKKFNESAALLEKKIALLDPPSYTDYMNLGKTYYQALNWGKSDTAFIKVIELKPEYIQGYFWRARVYSSKDPETKEGLAKPFYETVIEKAVVDSVKNSKELIESYRYLAYYYFKNKKWCESLDYWLKVEAIDPKDTTVKDAIKDLKARCPRK